MIAGLFLGFDFRSVFMKRSGLQKFLKKGALVKEELWPAEIEIREGLTMVFLLFWDFLISSHFYLGYY